MTLRTRKSEEKAESPTVTEINHAFEPSTSKTCDIFAIMSQFRLNYFTVQIFLVTLSPKERLK